MKYLPINVLDVDIRCGTRSSTIDCPLARAINRTVKQRTLAMNTRAFIGDTVKVDLPQKARTFISDYDEGRNVKPFSFPLCLNDDQARKLNLP